MLDGRDHAGSILKIHRSVDADTDHAHADNGRKTCAGKPFDPRAGSGVAWFGDKYGRRGAPGTGQIDLRQRAVPEGNQCALLSASRVAAASIRQGLQSPVFGWRHILTLAAHWISIVKPLVWYLLMPP